MAEYLERETAVMRLMQDGCSAKNVQTIMTLPAVDVEKISDLISLLFTPWYEKTVHHNIAHALFCIADALWLAVISKILGWW